MTKTIYFSLFPAVTLDLEESTSTEGYERRSIPKLATPETPGTGPMVAFRNPNSDWGEVLDCVLVPADIEITIEIDE